MTEQDRDIEGRELTAAARDLLLEEYSKGHEGKLGTRVISDNRDAANALVREGLAEVHADHDLRSRLYLTGTRIETALQLSATDEPEGDERRSGHSKLVYDKATRTIIAKDDKPEPRQTFTLNVGPDEWSTVIPVLLDDDLRALVKEALNISHGLRLYVAEQRSLSILLVSLAVEDVDEISATLDRLCDRVMGGSQKTDVGQMSDDGAAP